MKVGIISGSHRKNSQSIRVARWIEKRLSQLGLSQATSVLELATANIPLWDEGTWSGEERWKNAWDAHSRELASCDAFVIVAPEYGGMVPPALKNIFLLTSKQELAHKPALIVGVSSGRSGTYPISELRVSGYKNTRICYMPDHMILREVEKLFVSDEAATPLESEIRARLEYFLKVLGEYSKALLLVRESGVIDTKTFPNGL
ncbi:NADPH-dependent oxidoreductase [bacterium]|nr:NADPH-dependent oxidoreductase [bacterium]